MSSKQKLAAYIIAAALLTGVSLRAFVDYTASITYIAKTDGYAQAKAKYAPQPPAEAQAVAQGICSGSMQVAWFDDSFGVTQEDLDSYAARYAADGKTCDEVRYIGSMHYPDGSSDEFFAITISGRPLWYIATLSGGLVVNLQ